MNFIFLLFFGIIYGNPKPAETVDLKIVITNISALKGKMEMGIFNSPKTFLEKGQAYKTYTEKVTNDSLIFMLKGVPKDNYAVSVYHDKNSDNKCNLNFLGIPVEPYGFSKNFKPRLSKPGFDDCKINVQKNMSISIRLID